MDPETRKAAKAKNIPAAVRPEDKPFGEDIISKIPGELQSKIDSALITGTFLALSFVVLCGIGKRPYYNEVDDIYNTI
jgi:hypothetical protein